MEDLPSQPEDQFQPNRLQYLGSLAELYGLWGVNLLLKICTLGVYHFWGKTRLRRYLWSQTSFDGERFEYNGFGRELFFGYLRAMVLVLPVLILLEIASSTAIANPMISAGVGAAIYAAMFGVGGVVQYASRRYRLGRTRWRSIRFGVSGSALVYGRRAMGHGLLTAVTLGLYYPYMRQHLMDLQLNNIWFGTVKMEHRSSVAKLYPRFFSRWLTTVVLLGIFPLAIYGFSHFDFGGSDADGVQMVLPFITLLLPLAIVPVVVFVLFVWLTYMGAEYRYYAEHTRLGEMDFKFGFTNGQMARMYAVNFIMYFATLGVAYPWVVTNGMRFFARHTEIVGVLDYVAIAQSIQEAAVTGEGFMEALDVGDIGI